MQKTRKRRKSKLWVLLLIIAAAVFVYRSNLIFTGQALFKKAGSGKIDSGPSSLEPTSSQPSLVVSDSDDFVTISNLHSPNAILVRLDDHTILMNKNSEQKIYPASLTKIMTSIVAIENLPDLQKKIELPDSMFQALYQADASRAGFLPDEKVRANDLLYGVMLPSGAECCIGLADDIAGSEQKFVKLMNQKAAKLGMNNTHFTNTTGLQDSNHYTTVKDLSVLLSYALQNNTFRDIFTASRYSTSPTNKHKDGITFQNTMFKNIENPAIDDGKILGGKTGFTDEAGLCLASLAQKNGREYILVTAGAKGNHESEQYNIEDAYAVYKSITIG